MPFLRVEPDDAARVALAVEVLNAAHREDDPDAVELLPALTAGGLRYGWDLEPDEWYLYAPDEASAPVGVLELDFPTRDNVHLGWAALTVHPAHRRQGHGTAMLQEVIRRTRKVGRSTIWVGAAEDDLGAKAFVERFGFRHASHDARRRQVLADVDPARLEQLYAEAKASAGDYVLERTTLPTPDDVLEELVEVTAAINDAPMGDLTFEDEVFDLKRLRAIEAAAAGREETIYRIWARHRTSGVIGGHTVVGLHSLQPRFGWQGDTAVRRDHRGHRLGLLLKIEMMRWLAEREPQLEWIETWNQADNTYMISVNEALGYRLSRVFAMYELTLPAE
jgi:GNAT superfamily N-acetyltransferase